MRVYLAGPMTGIREFNFPEFDKYAAILKSKGHEVCNPADLDRELGFDPESQEGVSQEFLREALRRDLSAICDADAIAMLPGWENSGGARVEWMLAVRLGLRIFYLEKNEDDNN